MLRDLGGVNRSAATARAAKPFPTKNRVVKLELTKTGIYQVIAKSVVVEGRPFVLELISRSDVGIWFDSHGKKILLEKYGRDFYTDALTGAYCRQYFEDQRASLQDEDGVAMIDVDHFKEINDAYGHPVGDVALKKIVGAILSCIRSTDMLIRYGGDEFLIIFPQIQKTLSRSKCATFRMPSAALRWMATPISAFPSASAACTASSR